jgi:hypothetical protein
MGYQFRSDNQSVADVASMAPWKLNWWAGGEVWNATQDLVICVGLGYWGSNHKHLYFPGPLPLRQAYDSQSGYLAGEANIFY